MQNKYRFLIGIAVFLFIYSCNNDNDSGNFSSEPGASGSLARFVILGDYLYTVDFQDLNVFSISNEESPVLVNSINVGFDIETLFAYKSYLYIGSRNGMFIYDTLNSESPNLLSSVEHFTACDPVIANNTHAFVTLKGGNQCGGNLNVLEVYDVTNVEAPIFIARRNLIGPVGMAFYQDYLFVCDDEVKIFDISDPEAMSLAHSINVSAFDAIIRDNHLILIGNTGVFQYELNPNDIENETELSTLNI